MSATELSVLLGLVVPVVVAFITNTETSSKVKGLLALGLSVVVGVITAYVNKEFVPFSGDPVTTLSAIADNVTIAAVAAQTAFTMFIKPTGLAAKIQADLGYKDEFDLDDYSDVEFLGASDAEVVDEPVDEPVDETLYDEEV